MRLPALALLLLAAGPVALAGCSTGDDSRAGWSVYQGYGDCDGDRACQLVGKSGRNAFNLSVAWDGSGGRDFFGFYSSDVAPGTYRLDWSGPRAERVEVSLESLQTPCGEFSHDGAEAVAGPDHCALQFRLDRPLLANGSANLRWRIEHSAWDRSASFEGEDPVHIEFTATRLA